MVYTWKDDDDDDDDDDDLSRQITGAHISTADNIGSAVSFQLCYHFSDIPSTIDCISLYLCSIN
jgi:hypothetical protein